MSAGYLKQVLLCNRISCTLVFSTTPLHHHYNMNKFIVAFVVASVLVLGSCQHLSSELEEDFYGFLEKDCLQKGGLCIVKPECAKVVESPTDLCPEQSKDGFQCCSGLAIHDQRCRMHAGECSLPRDCNPNLVYKEASDCETDQVCCMLE